MSFDLPFGSDGGEFQAPATPSRPSRSDSDLEALRAENERQLLIIEALWRIVKEKLDLDDKELIRQITVIDMEDGRLDGRKAPSAPKPCPKCGRTLGKHRQRCLFCGEPIAPDPFAR